ncbi:cobalamin-binding protein [Jeotgalibacillus haloalkalitolerans]|uniref:Cobalamin-binding protein n=1 Tax=Jeotgalibacillus haloalkalitolerans TaxID=3104292 RepID=A0ABU5KQW7_9BACL|nr:cobalamin-binding protein [Jeotgalibacillus sp. HH7-29]MDZ5713629.1 cobalamin-binding protein [Jeotgalibacillus sp. HH7-29]
MRIVSLCPSNTELAAYLGLMDSIVGVDDFSDWPAEVKALEQLGPDLSIDIDKVEALKPDLILSSLSVPGMEKNIEELDRRGLHHICFNPQSLEDIVQDLQTLGQAAGIPERAERVALAFRAVIEDCKIAAAEVKAPPSLYWEWWPKPVFTPGGVNWLTEISRLAGGVNLYESVELASIQTDWADVLNKNPDVICMAWVGVQPRKVNPAILNKRPGWPDMDAVKTGKVHVLEEALYCRPSPRLLEGLIKLGKILHPEQYNKIILPDDLQMH